MVDVIVYGCAVGVYMLGVLTGLWCRRRQAEELEAVIAELRRRLRTAHGLRIAS